jgi:hypothetical protein
LLVELPSQVVEFAPQAAAELSGGVGRDAFEANALQRTKGTPVVPDGAVERRSVGRARRTHLRKIGAGLSRRRKRHVEPPFTDGNELDLNLRVAGRSRCKKLRNQ